MRSSNDSTKQMKEPGTTNRELYFVQRGQASNDEGPHLFDGNKTYSSYSFQSCSNCPALANASDGQRRAMSAKRDADSDDVDGAKAVVGGIGGCCGVKASG